MIRFLCVATLVAALAGCSTPVSQVASGSARPSLSLLGAPAGSELTLDGQSLGDASHYDGVNGVMSVEEGPHAIEVRQGSVILVKKRIFAADGEAVAIDVSSGGQ